MPNNFISTQTQIPYSKTILAEIRHLDVAPVEIPLIEKSLIEKLSAPSTPLASLALVKKGRR